MRHESVANHQYQRDPFVCIVLVAVEKALGNIAVCQERQRFLRLERRAEKLHRKRMYRRWKTFLSALAVGARLVGWKTDFR